MFTIRIAAGLQVDIRSRLIANRPAVVLSSGYGIFGFDEPVQRALIARLEELNIGWAQYTYAERNTTNFTTDLLISTGAMALRAVVEWVDKQEVSALALFGISFGATISLEVALIQDVQLLILINPVVDYVQYRTAQFGQPAIDEWRKHGALDLNYGDRPARSYYRFMEEAEGQNLLQRVAAIAAEMIICQAENDAILGLDYARSLAETCRATSLHFIPNADHVFATSEAIMGFLNAVDPAISAFSATRR